MAKPRVELDSVFLNVPYDARFQRLYLAYIAGLTTLGLTPRATLELAEGTARLDRIFALMRSCRYSVHDLSRVQLDRILPATLRFNMPFELGLSVTWSKLEPSKHTWFVFESVARRAEKSISDLKGTDFNIHSSTPEGVMRELCNAFVRRRERPTIPEMMNIYSALKRKVPRLKNELGVQSLFGARVFRELCALAAFLLDENR